MKKYISITFLFVIMMVSINVLATFPGYLYGDTKAMLHDGVSGHYAVWHSIFYTLFVHGLSFILPGPELLNIINILFLWMGLWLLSISFFKRFGRSAFLFLLVPFFPGVLNMSGTPVIDQTLCDSLLISAGILVLLEMKMFEKFRVHLILCVVFLSCISFLMRPNVLISSSILAFCAGYVFLHKKRFFLYAATIFLSLGTLFILNHTVARSHSSPVTGVELKNLVQLSYYEQKNFFPGKWTALQNEKIIHGCYRPEQFDNLAYFGKCAFIEKDISGKALFRLWLKSTLQNPLVLFVSDFPTFKRTLLYPLNQTMFFNWPWVEGRQGEEFIHWEDKEPYFGSVNHILKLWANSFYNTFLSKPILSVIVLFSSIVIIYSSRDNLCNLDRIVLCILVSGLVYVMIFFVANIATEYRYYMWPQISGYIGFLYLCFSTRIRNFSFSTKRKIPRFLKAFLALSFALVVVSLSYNLPTEKKVIEITPKGKVTLLHVAFDFAAFNGLNGGVKYDGTDMRFLGPVTAPGWQRTKEGYVSTDNSKTFRIMTSFPYLDFVVGYKLKQGEGSFQICEDQKCNEVQGIKSSNIQEADYRIASVGHKLSDYHVYAWTFFFFFLMGLAYFSLNNISGILGRFLVPKCKGRILP